MHHNHVTHQISKKEQWERWSTRLPLLLSFFLPLVILLIICVDHGVYPFGDQCILKVDMYHQYCPFFTEMLEKLRTGGSFAYSYNIGLGADFLSLYAYYLASPLNWLLLLCPDGAVIEFMTILVVLKIALCGLTFAYYLKEHFEKNNLLLPVFACAYAFSGYVAAYAWNIMWMDCILLAPLILLGLERLVKENRPTLYYVTLAVSVLSNYYISIMICIFLVLWFFAAWISDKKSGWKALVRFAWYSLLAGGTGAVLILPEAVILSQSGSKNLSFPSAMEWYFNIIAELSRHAVLTTPYTGRDHWPNLYCGTFVLILVVMYMLNRQISWKKKLVYLAVVALFVVSFTNNMLDFIWHGLHFPDSLPGRQSFLYVFVLLILSYEAVLKLAGNKMWHIAVASGVDALFLLAGYYFSAEEMRSTDAYVTTAVLLAGYALVLIFYFSGKEKMRRVMACVGCALMVVELAVNFDVTGLGTVSRTAYTKDWEDYENVLEQADALAEAEGVLFYRTEELERKTKNDAALYGYCSATQFSSLMNLNVSHFYQKVGMEGGKNFYCYNGATPLLSAMLSVRYILADNALEENPMRTLVAQSGNTYLYENSYVLPLGFVMPEDAAAAWTLESGADISNQNRLAYLLGAEEPMLTEIPSESKVGESTIAVEEDGYIFASYEKTTVDNLTEKVGEDYTRNFSKVSHNYLLELGYQEAGSEISITNTKEETVQITAYRLNLDSVKTAFETLNKEQFLLDEVTDTSVKGHVTLENPGRLIFSIAQETGFTVIVDGEEVEPELFAEALISIPLSAGSHEVTISYHTPGIGVGAAVTFTCMALFAVTMAVRRKKKITARAE